MLKKVILIFFMFFSFVFSWTLAAEGGNTTSSNNENCVKLNTSIPWIGNKICMWDEDKGYDAENNQTSVNAESAFPRLMGALTKIVVSLIIAVGFLMIVVWWVMIASSWADQSLYWKWKDLILKVAIWIALLGLSWVILHMINPNFFK